ncbi:class I tRNA ligase family protein [Bacteroides acidifaciens]|uniref:class I tRNA ligase family protein n=1 Tax=Bacteroides acidifaciens TaxID=85831 RepID=UPI003F68E187
MNKTINWKRSLPEQAVFGKWLENLNDWNLSRSPLLGYSLPIWRTKDNTDEKCETSL